MYTTKKRCSVNCLESTLLCRVVNCFWLEAIVVRTSIEARGVFVSRRFVVCVCVVCPRFFQFRVRYSEFQSSSGSFDCSLLYGVQEICRRMQSTMQFLSRCPRWTLRRIAKEILNCPGTTRPAVTEGRQKETAQKLRLQVAAGSGIYGLAVTELDTLSW